jgi:hypothetical protein
VTTRLDVRMRAGAVAIALLVIGVLGFAPRVTTHYRDISFAGRDSGAELFGIFQVSVLQNALHILFGVVGIALSGTREGARAFLAAFGSLFVVLWIYGLAVEQSSDANFLPLDTADSWLHLALGAAMLALGTWTRKPATA